MRKVKREEIVTREEYEKVRPSFRETILKMKAVRRIAVGPYLTFLFENRETMKYQIQEMMRVEHITEENAIEHEITTYNELVPGKNEIKATLLIELDDPIVRHVKLRELVGLQNHVSLFIDNDYHVEAEFDDRQIETDKLSSVHYLTLSLTDQAVGALMQTENVEIVTTHPGCSYRQKLESSQIQALKDDISAE